MMRESADGWRVGASVVIDHDHDLALGAGDVVQGLPGHAACQATVADHSDDVSLAQDAANLPRLGQTVGVGQRCGGV